ncbi:class F sortase, partial [Micromonospora sp. NPDC003776]
MAAPPASPPPTRVARGRSPWSAPLAVLLVLVGVFATGAGLGRTVGPFDWADASTGATPRAAE